MDLRGDLGFCGHLTSGQTVGPESEMISGKKLNICISYRCFTLVRDADFYRETLALFCVQGQRHANGNLTGEIKPENGKKET